MGSHNQYRAYSSLFRHELLMKASLFLFDDSDLFEIIAWSCYVQCDHFYHIQLVKIKLLGSVQNGLSPKTAVLFPSLKLGS